jgi:hypothetical protein
MAVLQLCNYLIEDCKGDTRGGVYDGFRLNDIVDIDAPRACLFLFLDPAIKG